LGVIDSLSAGYRFLGRRVELLLAPILLDLLFWLGPRLSAAPLFQQIASFYTEASSLEGLPSDSVALMRQMADLLRESSDKTNLLGVLANSSLLHVPSLLAAVGPFSDRFVWEVANPLAAVLLLIGFSLLGVLVGVVYMNLLARTLPLGDAPKPMSFGAFVEAVLRHWLMILAFVALVVLALVIGSVPVVLATAVLTLISPFIGSLILLLVSGTMLVLFFYLYFVTAAVVVDNLPVHRAIVQSFGLVRNNFWATLGFVVLYNVITLGFARIMTILAETSPLGTIAAILIYAYIGSGLTMGLLVFYRTRIVKDQELLAR
jgi:hypothetical protein